MKTAVEWLVEEINKLTGLTIQMDEPIIEQAKAIEKEQIMDVFNEGYTQCSIEDLKPTSRKRYEDAEQYYKETFKSE